MRALFDVNALLAIFDSNHAFHARARTWWSENQDSGWATCPLTENGFVRIMSQGPYGRSRSPSQVIKILSGAVGQPGHAFWNDDASIADASLFHRDRIFGPKQITDIYLLGLAVKNSGRLVTLDRRISLAPVVGAETHHLVVV